MTASLFLGEIDRKGLRIIGKTPHGFASGATGGNEGGYDGRARRPSGSSVGGFGAGRLLESSDGRWALGDRVYHDDRGYGSITQILEGEEGPVIKVVFETGYETRFLSRHQSSAYTKIRED